MSGFDIIETNFRDNNPSHDWRAKMHEALDRIIGSMKSEKDMAGGSVELRGQCPLGHDHVFRIAVCEFTGQKECVWCNGTGVEES